MSLRYINLRQTTHAGLSHKCHINSCSRRAQRLASADIRCRLLPANVLLPRGQGQDIAAPAFAIDSLADKPARQVAHKFTLGREETKSRSAQRHGYSQALPFPHRDIDAERSGRL